MKEAFDLIQASGRILIHLHPKPDPDSIGSALATYHALKGLGKEVTVIQGDTALPSVFSFLPGFDAIVRKSYFDIDLSQFDLFIIQDSGSKEMISRKGEVEFPSNLKTIVIDHHKTNTKYADINLVDATYAATAEFLYDLFVGWGIQITKDIAACLYVGIYGDTGGFKYSYTTPRTMEIVATLCKIYPDFSKLIDMLDNSHPKEKIFFDRMALNAVEVHCDGVLALSAISYDQLQKEHISREDTDNNVVASTLLTVKDWKVGAVLIEKEPDEIGISLRSKGDIDVSKVAVILGGGGHKNAAGARLVMPLEEAKAKVIAALGEVC